MRRTAHLVALVTVATAIGGCAADGPNGLALVPIPPHQNQAGSDDISSLGNQPRSMAAKVLAAMALERVTGRKPDPSRFYDP